MGEFVRGGVHGLASRTKNFGNDVKEFYLGDFIDGKREGIGRQDY